MTEQITVPRYAEYECQSCEIRFADELAPVGFDYWPTCRDCGAPAELIDVLLPRDALVGA
jgi:hypothetical protein